MSGAEREGPVTDPERTSEPPEGERSASTAPAGEALGETEREAKETGADATAEAADDTDEVDEDAETVVKPAPEGLAAAAADEPAAGESASEDTGDGAKADAAEDPGAEPASSAEAAGADEKAEASAEDEAEPEEGTDGIRVVYYGTTDVGLIREHNEDNFLVADLDGSVRGLGEEPLRRIKLGTRGAVFAVCDGMGGAAAGEVASQMAVDTIYEFFDHVDGARDRDHFARRLVKSIEEAGNRIFSAAKMDRTRRGMGTTATVAGLMDKVLFVGQVGDSRAYILRGGELGLITKDQSLVNQLIEAGQLTDEEAEAFEHSNIILQALGTTEDVTVDLTFLELRRGDRLMMCSDGLSGLVHHDMIKEVLQTTPDLPECARKLIEMANAGGGHDNITVVCADFRGDDLAPLEATASVSYQQYPLPIDEDPDRESLPPRDTSMKEGGRKPGSDVKKRRDRDGEAGAGADDGSDQTSRAEEPVRPFGWGLIAIVLLLAAVATAVAVAMGGRELSPDGDRGQEALDPVASEALVQEQEPEETVPEDQRPVEVRILTDVDGELFIDGQGYGNLADGEDVYVELLPGPHRFEAVSDGNVVTSAIITLRPGVPSDVALTMPTGVVGDPEQAEEAVVQQTQGAGQGARQPTARPQPAGGGEARPQQRPTQPQSPTPRPGAQQPSDTQGRTGAGQGTAPATGTSPRDQGSGEATEPAPTRRPTERTGGEGASMTTPTPMSEPDPPSNPFD